MNICKECFDFSRFFVIASQGGKRKGYASSICFFVFLSLLYFNLYFKKSFMQKEIIEKIKKNWQSGLTVSVVSIPLSISLAIAAGATPLMGIITAIWAGLVASFFGGSNFYIVGPTGALSGILIVFAISHGVTILPLLAILSGIIILIVYAFRLERYISFIPASVIHGFTLGVAFIIALGQVNFALGLKNLPVHERLLENLMESFKHLNQIHWATILLFVVGFVFLMVWRKVVKGIPGVIILAPIGILLGYLSGAGIIDVQLQTLFSKFGDISGNLFAIPKISFIFNKQIISGSVAIALVAILETLLSAKIADGMTKTKHDTRKEVLGVGLANIASGLFGGIPATAALARTSLNIKSGASDKMSATISSLFILLISAVLLFLFQYLPLAVVASILVFTATQMVELKHFVRIYESDKSALFIFLAVAVITVVEDPMMGIMAGATMALLIFANRMANSESEITVNKDKQLIKRIDTAELLKTEDHGDVVVYRFAGQLNYVNAQSHANTLATINDDVHTVILSLRNLFYVDMDGMDALGEMIETLEGKGKKVFVSAANGASADLLKKENWFQKMHDTGKVFVSTQEALDRS